MGCTRGTNGRDRLKERTDVLGVEGRRRKEARNSATEN